MKIIKSVFSTILNKIKNFFSTEEPITKGNYSGDDEIFEVLAKEKEYKRKKRVKKIVIISIAVLVVLVVGMLVLRRTVTKKFNNRIGEVVSYEATVGSISTTVSGSGTLVNVDEETLTLPKGVKVDEVVAKANSTIKKGDIIATVDIPSVMQALSTAQDDLDELDLSLTAAADDSIDSSIYSNVQGRVKKIYAEKEQSVSECMYQNGALAVISLDGYMAVDVTTDSLAKGDEVVVVRANEDSSEIEGTVAKVVNGLAKVLVTDNGPLLDEKVVVKTAEGVEVGEGELYINSPLKITGISGVVSTIYAQENATTYNGSIMFSLSSTEYSASYDSLLVERNEKAKEIQELVRIYTDGAFTSNYDGSLSEILYDEDTEYTDDEEIEVATFSPDKQMSITISVDEAKILSLELNQTAEVTISSIDDQTFRGVVSEISKVATSSSGVTKYSATITLDKSEGMLSGMSASVAVRIQGVEDAILIPVEALHQTSSTSFVYTSYDKGKGEFSGKVEVETGISNNSYVEIVSGLEEGDKVFYTETEDSAFASFGGGMMPGGSEGGGFDGNMPSGDFGGFSGGPEGMPGGNGGGPGGMPGGRQ